MLGGIDTIRRKVFLPKAAADALQQELLLRRTKERAADHGKIFTGIKGEPLSRESVRRGVRNVRGKSGVAGYDFVRCRDYIAVTALRSGARGVMDGNFFILPSSIHEILILPDDGSYESGSLKAMVMNMNRTRVRPEERLSEHVYYFDGEGVRIL